jgi:hypothetical protein
VTLKKREMIAGANIRGKGRRKLYSGSDDRPGRGNPINDKRIPAGNPAHRPATHPALNTGQYINVYKIRA